MLVAMVRDTERPPLVTDGACAEDGTSPVIVTRVLHSDRKDSHS